MSRQIEADLSGVRTVDDLKQLIDDEKLTDEDVKWLFDRNKLPRSVMVEIDRHLQAAEAHRTVQPNLEDRLRFIRNTGDIGAAGPDDIIDDDEVLADEAGSDGYDAMSTDELKAELEKRELPKSGPKHELVDRLRQSDSGLL